MQAAVAVAEGWVAGMMKLRVGLMAVKGLLVWVVLKVKVFVELVAKTAVLVVVGPSV